MNYDQPSRGVGRPHGPVSGASAIGVAAMLLVGCSSSADPVPLAPYFQLTDVGVDVIALNCNDTHQVRRVDYSDERITILIEADPLSEGDCPAQVQSVPLTEDINGRAIVDSTTGNELTMVADLAQLVVAVEN